jgi:hypothetical protein
MTPSRSFTGFEDAPNKVALIMVALPAQAYGEIDKSVTEEGLRKQGVTLEKREPLTLSGAQDGFLAIASQEIQGLKLHKWIMAASTADLTAVVTMQVPDDAKEAYPEAAIRAAFASVAFRTSVPDEEQLALLPFHLGDLAGFRIAGVLPGRAVMLTDAQPGAPPQGIEPHIMVAVAPGGPEQGADRAAFARDAFGNLPNVKDIRLDSSEPLRLGGQQGHQIMAQGKDAATGADVKIVQWLRFGGGAYFQMIGVSRSDVWTQAYARFRQVRDGVDVQ